MKWKFASPYKKSILEHTITDQFLFSNCYIELSIKEEVMQLGDHLILIFWMSSILRLSRLSWKIESSGLARYDNLFTNLLTLPNDQCTAFYFPIFAFAHRSLTVRSPPVHHAFSVCSSFTVRSQFTVLRSPFSVRLRSSLTKRSSFAHLAFTKSLWFANRSLSVLKGFGTPKWKDRS